MYLRTFIEQNTFISNLLNDIIHLTQEKVYHSLDVNFLTSDSFASCTEMEHSPFPYIRLENGKTVK